MESRLCAVDPDANLAMAHSNIRFANVGLNLNGTGAILGPLLIEESNTAAIALSNGADVSLSRVTVKNSNQAGISAQNSTFALNLGQIEGNVSGILLDRDSIISGNQNFGVTNEDPAVTVDATNNFWGSASGPAHASNPEGTGDRVSDNVEFIPFLTTPPPGLSMEGP
ncbi:MAG: hypothetical protein HYT79_11315 [Elusimicrobia bacterium]|nr:hypothetical protein [Elusimicrobiota bacterium]